MKKIVTASIAFCSSAMMYSCQFHFSTANLTNIKVCDNMDTSKLSCPQDHPAFDAGSQTIYTTCDLRNAPEETKINFRLTYLEAGSPVILSEDTMKSTETSMSLYGYYVKPVYGWLGGRYEARFMLDNDSTKVLKKNFTIDVPQALRFMAVDDAPISNQTIPGDIPTFSPSTAHIYAEANFSRPFTEGHAVISWYYLAGKDPELIDTVGIDLTNAGVNILTTDMNTPPRGWPSGAYGIMIDFSDSKIPEAIAQFNIQ